MKGVILAAGKGTRMKEITSEIPKPLVPISNKPILEHIIDSSRKAGVDDLLIIVQHEKEQMIDYFRDGKHLGVNISYVEQPEMRGTGEAASLARDFAGTSDFFLMFGDIMTPSANIRGVVETFRKHGPFLVLTVRHVDDPYTGAAVYVKDGLVEKIIEKPPRGTSTTNFDNAGIFVFSNGIFDLLEQIVPSPRNEYELTDALQMAIDRKLQVRAYELEGYWSNVSSPDDIIRTNALVLRDNRKDYVIDDGASVDDSCILGPNVCIAACSRVDEGSRIANSVISKGAIIEHGVTLDYVYVRENRCVKAGQSMIGSKNRVLVL